MLRVLVVDDHPSFRRMVVLLLRSGGYDVVGEAVDGQDAARQVAALQPDLVLLDVLLPDTDGFDVARRLAEHGGAPRVILVSSADQHTFAARLAVAPVAGFVPKYELTLDRIAALAGQGGPG